MRLSDISYAFQKDTFIFVFLKSGTKIERYVHTQSTRNAIIREIDEMINGASPERYDSDSEEQDRRYVRRDDDHPFKRVREADDEPAPRRDHPFKRAREGDDEPAPRRDPPEHENSGVQEVHSVKQEKDL